MLGENIITYDSLETVKNSVKDLTCAFMEAENQNLKQTLKQMRDQEEQNHERLYHIAEQNGYYLSAAKASPQEISRFNNFFQQTYQNAQLQQQGFTPGSQQQQRYTSGIQQRYTPGGQQQGQQRYTPAQQTQQRYTSGGQQAGQNGQQVQQGVQYQPSSQQQ